MFYNRTKVRLTVTWERDVFVGNNPTLLYSQSGPCIFTYPHMNILPISYYESRNCEQTIQSQILVFSIADFCGCNTITRSSSGVIMIYRGGAVCLLIIRPTIVSTTSMTEGETDAAKEQALWKLFPTVCSSSTGIQLIWNLGLI